jgi:hypothetical protein
MSRLAFTGLLVTFLGGGGAGCECSRSPSRAAEASQPGPETALGSGQPLGLDRSRLQAAPLTELSFVPADAQGVVRVDLGALAARNPGVLKTFDFVLRAQQPKAWDVLHQAHLTAGKELAVLYLVVSPTTIGEPYLVAGMGKFDPAPLGELLAKSKPQVETAVGHGGSNTTIYTWSNPGAGALGATEAADEGHTTETAIGVADGLIVCGPPLLVRASLAALRGDAKDVRTGALADELIAVDSSASAWGAAVVSSVRGPSPLEIPGLEHGHFSAALANPGPELDGILELSADFTSPADAQSFADKLGQIIQMMATVSARSPLGPMFDKLHAGAHIKVEGARVTASSTL